MSLPVALAVVALVALLVGLTLLFRFLFHNGRHAHRDDR